MSLRIGQFTDGKTLPVLLYTELERLPGHPAYNEAAPALVGLSSSMGGVARLNGRSNVCFISRYLVKKSVDSMLNFRVIMSAAVTYV